MTFPFHVTAGLFVILAGTRPSAAQEASPSSAATTTLKRVSSPSANANEGERLYNGIRLPKSWPPMKMRPSDRPMPVPYLLSSPAVVPINIGRQLFVDDFLVAKTDLTRTFHHAEKYAGNPVLKPDTPQELEPQDDLDDRGIAIGVASFLPGGAFYDPAAGHFQFWYTAGHRGGLATATSKDGLKWTRPKLARDGGNILIPKARNPRNSTVWLDLDAEPAARLKLHTVSGQKLRTSPDGLTWTPGKTAGMAADYSSFFHNPFRDVWVYSIKSENHLGRVRQYAEAKVFEEGDWKNAVCWMNADKLDVPDPQINDPAQLYSHVAVAYESLLLGEFVIHRGPHNSICAKGKFPKRTDISLGYSRDGFHWSRPDREAFIPQTNKDGDWDRRYIQAPNGVCFIVGDKLIFPYSAFSGYAPDGTPGMYSGAAIGLAMLRRDGFASMDAGAAPGALETRPVTFDGKYFFVNVDAPEGELRVEAIDEAGRPIAPFTLANCDPVKTDSTIQRVTWKGADNLSALQERPVRFRFRLENGKLFAFWVSPDETGASYGYVAGGGPGYKTRIDNEGLKAYPK
jgi:hypothetical protein